MFRHENIRAMAAQDERTLAVHKASQDSREIPATSHEEVGNAASRFAQRKSGHTWMRHRSDQGHFRLRDVSK